LELGAVKMAEEIKDIAGHILAEIHRIHNSHDKIYDKLSEQGETLVRNTVTLEEHVRRTNLLENKMTHIETEVNGLRTHINKVNFFISLLKPTRQKIKWILIILSLFGGSWGGYKLTDGDNLNKTIEKIQKIIE
jgi:hypothetical protein